MTLGIPRALLYYKYGMAWKVFLEELGQKVIISPKTNKKFVKKGVGLAENEICTPVKIFYGHVDYLKDKVDALFIPRVVSIEKSGYTCPKFLGLPDMVKVIDDMPRIISPTINLKLGKRQYYKTVFEVGSLFSNNKFKIFSAYLKATAKLRAFEKGHLTKKLTSTNVTKKVRIGLAGHPYNLLDEFMSMNLIKRLEDKGVELITAEMVRKRHIEKAAKTLPKRLFWSYEKELVGAAIHWVRGRFVDGIIYVIAFPCGPDSVMEIVLNKATKKFGNIPIMSLVFDEHTAEAGLVTRLEAFIDQLAERKSLSAA